MQQIKTTGDSFANNTADLNPSSSPKNLLPLVFGAIVLVVLSSFGTYFVLSSKQKQPPASQNLTPTLVPTIIQEQQTIVPSEKVDETLNWKTYKNEKYGYEIKCPENSTHNIEVSTGNGIIIPYFQEICFVDNDQVRLSIMNLKDMSQLNKESIKKTLAEENLSMVDIKTLTIDGRDAIRYKTQNKSGQSVASIIEFSSKQNGKRFFIRGFSDNFFDQILSTFKFLDQASTNVTTDSEDWQEYNHSGFPNAGFFGMKGFKLYYPKSWQATLVNKREESPPHFQLKLVKDQAEINIGQGVGSAASCLYPEDPDKEGMYAKYGEYKEFTKNKLIWRRAKGADSKDNVYDVCEKIENWNEFAGVTSIGAISLKNTSDDQNILKEFDEILQRIEILD